MVVKARMWSGMVVVLTQPCLSLLEILVGLQEDVLVFHSPPQPLSKDIVHTAAPTIHANLHLAYLQFPQVGFTRKVAALV